MKRALVAALLILAPGLIGFTCAHGKPNSANSQSPGGYPGSSIVREDAANGTASCTQTGPQKEWTMEEMLLARPMGMSGEERDFDFSHKAPETIGSWTLPQFQEYLNTAMGKRSMFSEWRRWNSLNHMLAGQLAAGKAFMAGKGTTAAIIGGSEPAEKALDAADKMAVFEQIKGCRLQLSANCKAIEALKEQAAKQGRLPKLEAVMSEVSP
jgi:hypothetical protein